MIVLIDIRNSDWVADYRAKVPAILASYGGEYITVGEAIEQLEGTLSLPRGNAAILRFPDIASIKAFRASEEYRPFLESRLPFADAEIFAFEASI